MNPNTVRTVAIDFRTRKPVYHALKCNRIHFEDVLNNTKRAEVRRNDRNYLAGDILRLMEVQDAEAMPLLTGRETLVRITHVLPGGQYGIDTSYVVLSIEPFAEHLPARS